MSRNSINSRADKFIQYVPPETGRTIQVSFYFKNPSKILSPVLDTKSRALLIYDGNLDEKKVGDTICLIKRHVRKIHVLSLDYGSKSLARVKKIWAKMVRVHPDVAIALGGGTICDLVGFASSCYQRGLDHILFPTTLLSMVDACIGGKTGLDFGGVKNSIGRVHHALESHCIFPFLTTLPRPELISGMSEIIKVAVLFDKNLFEMLNRLPSKFELSIDWFNVITRSAELKTRVSQEHLLQRSKLLYGHNIGHGFETLGSTYRRHGDCVSIGINYELALAVVAGIVKKDLWDKQRDLITKFDLPCLLPKRTNLKKLKAKMSKYKLFKDGIYFFVIPKKVGEIFEDHNGYFWKIKEKQFDSFMKITKDFIK